MISLCSTCISFRDSLVTRYLISCLWPITPSPEHAAITGRDVKDDAQLILEHGKPMIFGKDRNKGIRLNNTRLEVVEIGKDGVTERDLLVHDQYSQDPGIHLMLAKMQLPEFPVAMGVLRSAPAQTYNQLLEDQIEEAQKVSKISCVDDLLNSGDTWEI